MMSTSGFLRPTGEDKLDCSIWREPVIYRENGMKARTKITRHHNNRDQQTQSPESLMPHTKIVLNK